MLVVAKRVQLWLTPQPTLRRPGPRWTSRRTWKLWRKPERGGGVPGNGLNASARYPADSLRTHPPTHLHPLGHNTASQHSPDLVIPSSSSCHLCQLKTSLSKSIRRLPEEGVFKAEIITEDDPSPHRYYFKHHYLLLVSLVGRKWRQRDSLCCHQCRRLNDWMVLRDHQHYSLPSRPWLLLLLALVSHTAKGFILHPTLHAVIICLPHYY